MITQEVKVLIGIGIGTVLLIVLAVFFLSKSTPQTNTATPADPKVLVRDSSNKIATDSAKVTVVEFGDYQCPACLQAQPMVDQMLKDYAGKISFVFRNFPLAQHPNAPIAAEAAEAAGAQGKYWPMHDKLYANQNKWAGSSNPLPLFKDYATELSLDVNQFEKDVSSNKFADKINTDQTDGYTLGVNATPTFYINNQKVTDLQSYTDLKNKIDAGIAGKN